MGQIRNQQFQSTEVYIT